MKRAEMIEKLRSGEWELGEITGISSRYWMQSHGLMCGGETMEVTSSQVRAAVQAGLIRQAERRKDDPFWLVRYEIAAAAPSQADRGEK